MKASKDIEVQEWLNRRTMIADQIRYAKEQQWRTLYYTLLFYAAAVSAFQLKVYLSGFYTWAKWLSFGFVIIVGVAVFIHFMTLAQELDLERLAAANIEDALNRLTGVRDVCNMERDRRWSNYSKGRIFLTKWLANILIDTEDRKKRRSRREAYYLFLYFVPFTAIHMMATVATFIIIAYGR